MKTILVLLILFSLIALPVFGELTAEDLEKIRDIVKSSETELKSDIEKINLKIDAIDTRLRTVETGVAELRGRNSGVSTAGRISELLLLRVGDVWQNGSAVSDLLFEKNIVKGGEVSRAVPVNADGRAAIDAIIAWHQARCKIRVHPSNPRKSAICGVLDQMRRAF